MGGALASAIRHVNASVRQPISEDDLVGALRSGSVPPGYEHHLRAFFDETEVETLSDIVRSGVVDYAALAMGARRLLPEGHDTVTWLDERA